LTRKLIDPDTRFGNWTVLDNTVVNTHNMSQVVARCDCGHYAVIIAANLREGKTSACSTCGMVKARRAAALKNRLIAPVPKLNPATVQEIRLAIRAGTPLVELSRKHSVNAQNLRLIDRGLIWKNVPYPQGWSPRLTNPVRDRLSPENVAEIKLLITQKVRGRVLAKRYGVSENTISAIKRNEKFHWVPWPEGHVCD
jgi:hypothetical protein